MIKAILIDDEINAIKNLEWELNRFCKDIEVCKTFTNPLEAISEIDNLQPDCVFLDIEMPEMDGFQFLSKLQNRKFDLIITTAYDNYAIRAFKEKAIDYLLKPIDTDDLIETVERIKANKEKNNLGWDFEKLFSNISVKPKKIALPLMGKTIFVELNEIIYCKSDGNYTEVHLLSGKKEMLSKTMKLVESIIDSDDFFRVHHSYLVNINFIKEYFKGEGHYIVLKNNFSIPVSRNKKDLLIQKLIK